MLMISIGVNLILLGIILHKDDVINVLKTALIQERAEESQLKQKIGF